MVRSEEKLKFHEELKNQRKSESKVYGREEVRVTAWNGIHNVIYTCISEYVYMHKLQIYICMQYEWISG